MMLETTYDRKSEPFGTNYAEHKLSSENEKNDNSLHKKVD